MSKFRLGVPCIVGVAAMLAAPAHAASFYLRGANTIPLGLAFAGQAVGIDPSTVATNPAGMTRYHGLTLSLGGATVWGSREFDGIGFSALGVPTGTDTGGNAYGPHVIGAGYAIYEPHPDWRLGLAVYSPFGLATYWNDGWVGRYQGIASRLTTVNLTPAVAWQVTPWLSLGAGFQAQYADAKLSNALDTGALVGVSTAFDSLATFRGDDWAFGWSIGVTVMPLRGVQLGVSWRSPLTQHLSGDAEFAVNPALAATPIAASLVNRSASARLALPGTLAVGASWDIHPQVTLLAEFQWQNWSRFNEVRVQFGPPPLADFVSIENYRDSVFAAIAAEWRISERWAVRGGVGYDQTPTRDQFRTVRVPDADQIILGVGGSARLSRSATIDIAYAHFFARDASINNLSTNGDRVIGTARGDLNEVALTLRLNF